METLKSLARRFGPKLLYPAFYLLSFVVFVTWTFPYDKLKERLVSQFNAKQRTTQTPQELQIDELDSSFLTGVKAKGIRLVSASSEPGKPPSILALDEARARISLLGLLVGNKEVSFRIDAFDGTIKGSFADTGKAREIEVNFDGVDIGRVEPIAANAGFPLEGRLGGALKLTLPEGRASKGNGTVSLEVKEMHAGNAKELSIKTPMGPFTLPRLKVGTFAVSGEAKDGVFKIVKVSAQGGDVDVSGDGRVQMREVATDGLLDANLKFKINDGYRNKNDKTKLLFGAPGSKEKPMLEMDPKMSRAKTSDGFYALRISGTLGRPDVQAGSGGFK